jgi:hypothetical protein
MPTKTIFRGFLTIELMIALALFTVMTAGAFGVAFGGQTMSLDVGLTKGGVGHALSSIQTASQGASALAGFNALSDTSDTTGFYDETQEVSTIAPCMKALEHRTYWDSEHNRSLSVGLATLVASLDVASRLGGDCDPFPPSPLWDAPAADPISDPIFSGSQATDVDAFRQGGSRYALVTTEKNPGHETLWMIDVTDLEADPLPYSAFETDDSLFAVDVASGFAYVAGATTTAQNPFMVFDISNPASISLAAQAPLPSANSGIGRSIYYYDDMAYIGTQYLACVSCSSSVNNELHVFDVANPASPVWVGSINVDRNVNDIVVRNGIAYVATGPGGDNTVLKIYDVADPASAEFGDLLSEYTAPTAQAGTALYLLGDYLYLGRERSCANGCTNTLFVVLDVSNPETTPVVVDSTNLNISNGTAVEGIHVQGNIAFIVTSDLNGNQQSGNIGDGPFIMYDVSDPGDIELIDTCTTVNWSEKATALDMIDNIAFTANESQDALHAIQPTPACTP